MAATTEPRLPLSRDRILQAALKLADESGIESLTMRGLGQALGFEAMSLYNHVLDGYIFGFSLWETSHTYTAEEVAKLVEKFAQTITVDTYPHLHEHAQQHSSEGPHREVSAFEFGLDLIVDGLEKVHNTALT